MGSVGFDIEMTRIGDGDASELFYAMCERMLDDVWNYTSRYNGFKAYLNDPNVSTWMSDRHDENDHSMWFAFWNQGIEKPIADYAIHVARRTLAFYPGPYQAIAKQHGFELKLAPPSMPLGGRYAKHGNSICRLQPWKRGRSLDELAEYDDCTHRGGPPKSNVDTKNYRASAMTGWCACPTCKYDNKAHFKGDIAGAWAALDDDETGRKLLDEPGILGDWIEERGVKVTPEQLAAVVAMYKAVA